MKRTSRRICGALLGLGVLGLIVPGSMANRAGADDAADYAHQQAQAQREREEHQRQCEQAQRDREQADRDRQAQQDWYNQQAQAQRERDAWYAQQAQTQRDYDQRQQERAQKEWDDWMNQRAQAQNDWFQREQAQKAADDWQAHLDYHKNLQERIAQICRERDEILGRAEAQPSAPATPAPRVREPLKNPFLGAPAPMPLPQAFPHLIENPYVVAVATKPGRLQLDARMIQNPFVRPQK